LLVLRLFKAAAGLVARDLAHAKLLYRALLSDRVSDFCDESHSSIRGKSIPSTGLGHLCEQSLCLNGRMRITVN